MYSYKENVGFEDTDGEMYFSYNYGVSYQKNNFLEELGNNAKAIFLGGIPNNNLFYFLTIIKSDDGIKEYKSYYSTFYSAEELEIINANLFTSDTTNFIQYKNSYIATFF